MRRFLLFAALAGCMPTGSDFDLDFDDAPAGPTLSAQPTLEQPVLPVRSNAWMEPGERLAFIAGNDNLVCLRLDVGADDEVVLFAPGDEPKGTALDDDGSILVTTPTRIRRVAPDWSDIEEVAVAPPGVEFGLVEPDSAGCLVVTGETPTGGVVLVYDADTGDLLDGSAPVPATATGLVVRDGTAYVAEDTGAIVQYDVAAPERKVLVPIAEEPAGLDFDDDGLVVATAKSIERFDAETGAPLGEVFAMDGLIDVQHDPVTGHYFVTNGTDRVFELDAAGNVVEEHRSGVLEGAGQLFLAAVGR